MFSFRLILDAIAASFLIFCLTYWWLGNLAHEIIGTLMLALVIVHNVFNRRWYATAARIPPKPRHIFNIAVTAVLAASMLMLLVTSAFISEALSGIVSRFSGFTLRQIHVVAAYWALVAVSVHLGLRWTTIMGAVRSAIGIVRPNRIRTIVLRSLAALLAAHGVWSFLALDVASKLTMRMTLDWWDFEESVVGFFVHCIAIVGLFAWLTHFGLKLLPTRSRKPQLG